MIIASAISIVSLMGSALQEDVLPRRGGLGVGLAPSAQGIAIASVPEGSAGADAGLQVGDLVVEVQGRAVTDWLSFQAATTTLPAGEETVLGISREGEVLTLTLTPSELPAPTLPGARVELGTVGEPGARVRTLTLIPEADSTLANGDQLPAVYFIQGIPCQAIDNFANPDHYRVRLFQDLIDAGFIVGMADKPGIGDSEGEACLDGGFDREVEAFTHAAAALAARADTDPSRIYGVGLSMGGIQAPLVARDVDLAGIVTWGTGVSPWFDYIVSNFRLRAVIQGQPAEAAEASLRNMRLILADLLIDEQSPQAVRDARPEAAAQFEASFGAMDSFAGRNIRFHQEIDEAPVWSAWQSFQGTLLAVQGGFDWVASAHDHRLAVDAVNLNQPGAARFAIVDGLDHAMTAHESLADSFANTFQGAQSDAFHDEALAWLVEQAGGHAD